jgi:NitT/TauT family transport system ATP-binding protein
MGEAGTGRNISFVDVEHWYPSLTGAGTAVRVLRPTTLAIAPSEFVAIVGPSGCGKTTLLHMVAGLMKPTTGQVLIGGAAPRGGDPGVGYLLAQDSLLPWRRAVDNVVLPLEIHGMAKARRLELAHQALGDVGLTDFANAYPSQLSHGMRQRVAVARTLVSSPDTLLMDEPFSALDAQTRLALQAQCARLWERLKSTVVFVTHDLGEAITLADRVIVMSARPGHIKADIEIPLGRPRKVYELQGSPEFHEIYARTWAVFRSEVATDDPALVA